MKKVKIGIIGSGNIGTDLLFKVLKSSSLECGIFTGKNPHSQGLQHARQMGISTSFKSIDAIVENPDCCEIVFDASSAESHLHHAPILLELNKFTIDLTPSHVGKMCVPVINLDDCLNSNNVSLISCAAQAAIPIISIITEVHKEIEYLEVISSSSSKSIGPATRLNLDEFLQTSQDAITLLTGVKQAKVILIVNPADPPVYMHNTIYTQIKNPKIGELEEKIALMEKRVQKTVPGFKVSILPALENNRLTFRITVTGSGDYLPRYAGNLDIATCNAVKIAEEYAKRQYLKQAVSTEHIINNVTQKEFNSKVIGA